MRPLIRIFSHEGAREIDGVIDLLREQGADIHRLNFNRYPEELRLSMTMSRQKASSAAWAHDLHTFSTARSLTGLNREVSLRECDAFVDGLLLREEGRWLNSPEAIRISGNKAWQLHLAERLKIPIPPYLITNDAASVQRFIGKHRRVISKSLNSAYLIYGRRTPLKVYTQRIEEMTPELCESLNYGPSIFQREIERACEFRVTCVDGKAFSIGIDTTNMPDVIVDVRQMDYKAEHDRFFRPRGIELIEQMSLDLTKALNLSYAGCDWAMTPSGTYYFFEVNPCGAFRSFEELGAGPISSAIASALISRC